MSAGESIEVLREAVDMIEGGDDLSSEDLEQVALALAMLKSYFRLGAGRASSGDEEVSRGESRRERFGAKILGR